ncbi:hypothetical protein CROQUDRAFT_658701, partial [Cronartium quercuum f. sp. fusiforme G11]
MAPPKGSTRNPNWFKSSTETNSAPSAADTLSYALIPKPFKDEKARKGPRRNKTLKQILGAERLRAKQVALSKAADGDVEMTAAPTMEEPTGEPTSKKSKKEAVLPVNLDVNYLSYIAIEAPPSLIPPKKYCDITGLEAPYVDPKTRLRYHNAEVYELIKTFGPGVDQVYLSLRGAHITL